MAAAAAVGKTPVSVLQELLSRRGTTPKYELVQIEGAIHEPTFRYRVTVGDVVAMGTGRSKKEAKHSAAKALLDKMMVTANSGDDGVVVNSENISEVKTEILSPYDNKIPGNPIGSLQEMCMSRRWPPPNYEMVHEEGLPHERLFTIACYVFKYKETGTGKSKKLAKRQAAHKMWQRLQDLPVTATVAPVPDDDDENTPLNTSNFNFGQFLQEIATEQRFEVTYVDIEEKSVTGKTQCLIQLSTVPVAVCYGSGNDTKEAQSSAAKNALEYLKILSKK
ncbi:RISC-loading complex subunit tarbp2 isoform X2 [Schistocerca cancellata]|uniref:RISC-loading complex subunit tarbp2 isoform X2 n=1 Tax=Schistocerca cancellata TaxID=274614 RepID=UPI00211758B3|nr:RISC-loading complex subunit tarbp2 isoform X2 [Schistocerca cancellata]